MNNKTIPAGVSEFLGEFIGTLMLVFFGCGSVVVTVLFSAHVGLFQIAAIWGFGVALAIYTTRHLSCAHLNPAVSIAMVVTKRMSARKLLTYLLGQFSGAFVAAALLYLLFSPSIGHYEYLHGIVRGGPESRATAIMFGEFYPNPGAGANASVTPMNAFLGEMVGTFILILFIFALTEGCNVGRPDESLAPLFIGLAVAINISIVAPLTQGGFNPARDLAPRMFAYLAGWRQAALPDSHWGFITVYVLGPIVGGILAALLFGKIIEPTMSGKDSSNTCR